MNGLPIFLIILVAQDRKTARYPGSTPISSYSNYTGLPFEFRWDDTYRTGDKFSDVYDWYSITFDIGSEARSNKRCISLEEINQAYTTSRRNTVSVRNRPVGKTI